MARSDEPPDFKRYHKSITDELHTLKNRIRDIIQDRHWQTDGEWKEAALRNVLRRHLPESMIIGRGFIVTRDRVSTQIDVLIVDADKPTLFRDGDLMMVTPDAVRAIIEVKTALNGAAIEEAIRKLTDNAAKCAWSDENPPVWTGLFVYEEEEDVHEQLLDAVGKVQSDTGCALNCVAYGKRTFLRYWPGSDSERSQPRPGDGSLWRTYSLPDLAPSYFIGNLLLALSGDVGPWSGYAWFPERQGKEQFRQYERAVGPDERIECVRTA